MLAYVKTLRDDVWMEEMQQQTGNGHIRSDEVPLLADVNINGLTLPGVEARLSEVDQALQVLEATEFALTALKSQLESRQAKLKRTG